MGTFPSPAQFRRPDPEESSGGGGPRAHQLAIGAQVDATLSSHSAIGLCDMDVWLCTANPRDPFPEPLRASPGGTTVPFFQHVSPHPGACARQVISGVCVRDVRLACQIGFYFDDTHIVTLYGFCNRVNSTLMHKT
jgi:hypothetical protein